MRLIAFITDGTEVRKILEHIGVDSQAPRLTPARGPPLWADCDAPVVGEGCGCRAKLEYGGATGTRLSGRPERQLVTGQRGVFAALRGAPARATGAKSF